MPTYNSIYTGLEIDAAVQKFLQIEDEGGIATQTDLSNYLTITNAASTYLSQTDASNTYLTQSNASSSYAPLTGTGTSGTWPINISGVATGGAYGSKHWSSLSLAASNSSTQSISITTHGRPVWLCIMGNSNPTTGGSWGRAYIKRGDTELSYVTFDEATASANKPFCCQWLDTVAAGTYTYNFVIQTHSGTINYTEQSGNEGPTCVCFEI